MVSGCTSTSLCHAKLFFWMQSDEVVGIVPFFTARGLLDAGGGSRQALEALERERSRGTGSNKMPAECIVPAP